MIQKSALNPSVNFRYDFKFPPRAEIRLSRPGTLLETTSRRQQALSTRTSCPAAWTLDARHAIAYSNRGRGDSGHFVVNKLTKTRASSVVLVGTVIALNLIGDALRDILDPRRAR